MVISWWAAALVVVSTAIWFALLVPVFLRRGDEERRRSAESSLLRATVFLAVLWTAIAPPWNLGVKKHGDTADAPSTCFMIREAMPEAKVTELMKTAPRVVSEEDTRGPAAAAWVYDDQRCIVHLVGGRVVSVEQEGQ